MSAQGSLFPTPAVLRTGEFAANCPNVRPMFGKFAPVLPGASSAPPSPGTSSTAYGIAVDVLPTPRSVEDSAGVGHPQTTPAPNLNKHKGQQ